MASIRMFAPAKINLFLHVTGKRADGYHLLESLVAFADIGDEIIVSPADDLCLNVEGPFAAALSTEPDNSVLKAARLILKPGAGAVITLKKNLPVAAGLGGGSVDAAATLRALQKLHGLPALPSAHDLASSLGADVPVCLNDAPAMMRGIGELLGPVAAFPVCGTVLINPGLALSTADVFRALRPPYSAPLSQPTTAGWPDVKSLAAFLQTTRNDLTLPALGLVPEISAVAAALTRAPGCLIARMSGSGATCFGLFESPSAAQIAALTIAEAHPSWWIRPGRLGPASALHPTNQG
ncbi:MAG: 4-(cytidine 5'-diphospho)-2-C-methyl-D-erythritol kinase [Rhodospirillaceae bacterium]|nr:4-(cytidine 5'-diphospho)-2-C-methyl-D-erythritol kinase [Rhodospirillaceae bacterium]